MLVSPAGYGKACVQSTSWVPIQCTLGDMDPCPRTAGVKTRESVFMTVGAEGRRIYLSILPSQTLYYLPRRGLGHWGFSETYERPSDRDGCISFRIKFYR